MLENITPSLLANVLAESPSLRLYMAERVLAKYGKNPLVAAVEGAVIDCGDNKIAAIKAVRTLGKAESFYPLFPLDWTFSTGHDGILGLADSKKLVEYVAHRMGLPYLPF
jgi:hypothetical protein